MPSEDLSDHAESSSNNTNNASTSSQSKSELPVKSKLKQSSSSGSRHASGSLVSPKPNTPPLASEKKEKETSLASFALGLGSKFKATSFKIPHKAKKETSDDDDLPAKSPLSVVPTASSSTSKFTSFFTLKISHFSQLSKSCEDRSKNKFIYFIILFAKVSYEDVHIGPTN